MRAQELCTERIQGVVGKAQIEETPARYEVCITLRTEPTLEAQPGTAYEDPGALDDEARWYAGDFHEALSVDGILEGVRSGRTVVKINGMDDPMLETELSGGRVGNTVFADMATLSVRVTGGAGNSVRVIKNGEVLEELPIDSDPFDHELSVEAPSEGEDRYRHQVMSGFGPLTIGSYVWLRAADVPETGGSSRGWSCRLTNGADHDTGLLLAVFAIGACWRRRLRAC